MIFEMPTKIVVGAINEQAQLLKDLGTKACIVTGFSSSKKNGSLDDVIGALKSVDINYMVFDRIEENPKLETLEQAKDEALKEGCDFVIGIGGGSPLDAAKGIAIMIKNPHIGANNLVGNGKLDATPVVAVPTTAGTGSETTQYAILTDTKLGTKINFGQKVFPVIAFLDAKYMMDMPVDVTRSTALDAFSHLAESFLSLRSNMLSEIFVKEGLTLFRKCIPALLEGIFTKEDRENLLITSTLGGIAIAQTGTLIPHTMGYSMTYYKQIPHGIANIMFYREYLSSFKDKTKVNTIVELLGFKDLAELCNMIDKLVEVKISCTDDEIKKYTDYVFREKAKLANHPDHITEQDIYRIYRESIS
ncbi:MAG: hypothetical protein BEN19_05700 [Epulopiscium sp. Nuni2H_MBin003]|nr:MAG: hypothetical protein BEN19_05700 [Epulopiscium sp. Nuni2H_MBin003]